MAENQGMPKFLRGASMQFAFLMAATVVEQRPSYLCSMVSALPTELWTFVFIKVFRYQYTLLSL